METTVSKRVRLSKIISIIVAVTSLFYVFLVVAYFVAMEATLVNGNEYEMLGFIFGLIALPLAIAVLFVPVFRIVILICSLNLSKKFKEGNKANGLVFATGIMQIVDAVCSPLIYGFIASLLFLFSRDLFQGIPGGDLLYGLFGLTIDIPVMVKGVVQIISSVLLFKSKGELF